jgi:hypothetical protein
VTKELHEGFNPTYNVGNQIFVLASIDLPINCRQLICNIDMQYSDYIQKRVEGMIIYTRCESEIC